MRSLIVIAGALMLSGCGISARPSAVTLDKPIAIERTPLKAALSVPPAVETYRWSGGAASWSGSMMNADFLLGPPLAEALRTNLARGVKVVAQSEADLIVEPAVVNMEWRIDDDGQSLKQAAIGLAGAALSRPAVLVSVDVQLTAYTPDKRQVYRRTVTGRGIAWNGTGLRFSTERAATDAASFAVSEAAARAVQQMVVDPEVLALRR